MSAGGQAAPEPYPPIRDYAIIGDGHTAALVGGDGSIDWCCWPRFDSGAVFCRLLDAGRGGFCRVGPAGAHKASPSYLDGTNVLVTTFETSGGRFRLTDVMPLDERRTSSRCILRLVEGLSGRCDVEIAFRATFDFARAETVTEAARPGAVARSKNEVLWLASPAPMRVDGDGAARGTLSIGEGERRWVALRYGADPPAAGDMDEALRRTVEFWRRWLELCKYDGPYKDVVQRSALVLKLLVYAPTGAVIAAPTTSLPEAIGGVRNWDYRYTWLRDSSLVLHALETIGDYDEAIHFFEWLERLQIERTRNVQIMYAIDGSPHLPEQVLDHLEGYRGSRPVRVGNAAASHIQLDIYGEVLDAAWLCFERIQAPERSTIWETLRFLSGEACRNWNQRDRSIWEVRGEPQHFLYSKLMCWVATDRAIRLNEHFGMTGDVERWRGARDEIRRAILKEGYNERVGAFTQAFGSEALDASALAVPRSGFLPPSDPRVLSTVRKIREELMQGGLVCRYLPAGAAPAGRGTDDGLPGGEGAFTLCTLWLVDVLASQGEVDEARKLFERVCGYASHLGLLSEEVDSGTGELLGNYPQGFTHMGLIRSACHIAQAENPGGRSCESEPRWLAGGKRGSDAIAL